MQCLIMLCQIWHNLCSDLMSILAIQKQPTNRPQHLGHLKDLEISKYKRESKARMPIKCCCLIFVNCGLFSFLNIKKVKI